MLAYAFNALNHKDYEKLKGEDFENIYDLLASVLVRAVGNQVRLGLHREYIEEQSELLGVKGKIQVNESIRVQSFIRGRLVCSFDEFDHNVLMNKIIKTTLFHLTKCNRLNPGIKKDIKSLTLFFVEIEKYFGTLCGSLCLLCGLCVFSVVLCVIINRSHGVTQRRHGVTQRHFFRRLVIGD